MPRSSAVKPAAREDAFNAPPQAPAPSFAGALNKSSARILRVLLSFAGEGRKSHGISELSRNLGMTKNMVFRALNTLAEEGLVVRNTRGRYALGYRVFDLCPPALEIPDIRRLCLPFLSRIHELTGETVMLSIAVGPSSVVVEGIEGRGPLLSRVMHGRPIPLHAGPGSRALLAFRSDEEIARYIATHSPLRTVTPTTITDPDALWREVRLVRERGYALGYRDNLSGVTGVALPVFDANGQIQGAVSVGGPEDQFDDATLASFIPGNANIVAAINQRSRLLHFDAPRLTEF
jgi:DNA-binding IclR family transcriptional regulator